MTVRVLLGGNQFIGCASIVEVRGEQLLRVAIQPLRITLTTPPGWDDTRSVAVEDNQVKGGNPGTQVLESERSVVILSGENPIVVAVIDPDQPDEIRLRIDLRPIGIHLFDDSSGLHVGTNLFTGNRVSNAATAISLG